MKVAHKFVLQSRKSHLLWTQDRTGNCFATSAEHAELQVERRHWYPNSSDQRYPLPYIRGVYEVCEYEVHNFGISNILRFLFTVGDAILV